MRRSLFAFVPRGDAHFSIRLLEAMSFGCIPVVLSDGWVLPFDRTIHWPALGLHEPESQIDSLVGKLRALSADKIRAMQSAVSTVYAEKFASIDHVTEALLQEIEILFMPALRAVTAARAAAVAA
jgi:glycosyltransferase involved in cell wall biosynthesis